MYLTILSPNDAEKNIIRITDKSVFQDGYDLVALIPCMNNTKSYMLDIIKQYGLLDKLNGNYLVYLDAEVCENSVYYDDKGNTYYSIPCVMSNQIISKFYYEEVRVKV